MKNRIKYIRKEKLDKTQTQLGLELGVSRDVVSNIELGRVDPPDTFIQLFCMKFGVDEHWLRTGEGEMFVKNDDSLISKLSAEYNLSDTEKRVLSVYLRLDETRRTQLVDFISYFSNELIKSASPEIAATVAIRPAASDRKLSRTEKEELMKRQLDAEEKGQTSSASIIINGLDGGKLA